MISTKRALPDVWPINKKRFFVLVDPETITDDAAAPSALSTITTLVSKRAKVILATSFGSLQGIAINPTEKQRETALKAFQAEGGAGYTNYFANLAPKQKLAVLDKLTSKAPSTCNANRSTGKTTYFASLSNEEKAAALKAVFPEAEFSCQSSAPLVEKLRSLFPGTTITFAADPLNAHSEVSLLKPGEIVVLENLRFYRNEISSSAEERQAMASVLASYCDNFINESFATAHEVKSSNVALPKLLRHGAAGLLMDKELAYFKRLLTHPARPTGVVVAGTHVAEKLRLVLSLVGKVEKILIAGEVALPFLAAMKLPSGKGLDVTQEILVKGETVRMDVLAGRILRLAAATDVKIILPVDHVANGSQEPTRFPVITQSAGVPSELYALDVGPHTLQLFAQEIRTCRTVFWSGTLGLASISGFEAGTETFAKTLAASGVFSVVGGRHTTRCVRSAGVANNMSHLCTGGVSCLEVLQGNLLPAVEVLTDAVAELDESTVASVNELLRHLPLFEGCSSHQLNIVAKKAVRRAFNAGDFLIYDGDRFTNVHIVAKGTLVACPKSLYGLTTALRRITKGQAVGLYEHVTLHASSETIQVADNDTVVYQISHASLYEAINESPELATQLIVNLSERLRASAALDAKEAASACKALKESLAVSRIPPICVTAKSDVKAFPFGDATADAVATGALHKLALEYRPFLVESGTCKLAIPGDGIFARMGFAVVRSLLFNHSINVTKNPYVAGVLSAVLSTPLRLLADGVPLHKFTAEDVLDSALISSALSFAPAASQALFVRLREKTELSNRRQMTKTHSAILALVCRFVVGLLAFPLVARRGNGLMNARSFAFYSLKHILSLLFDILVRRAVRNAIRC